MANSRAIESETSGTGPQPSRVIAFRAAPGRSTRPRVALDQRLARAGFAIAAHVVAAYENAEADGVLHMPTVVAVLATLAAEAAQSAAALNRRQAADVLAGGWVLGGAADAILFRAHADADGVITVWDVIADAARLAGIAAADMPDLSAVLARAEAHIGTKPYPVLTVAAELRPKALLRAAAARRRHATQGLAAEEGLTTPHEQALALGAAIGHTLRHEPNPVALLPLIAEVLIGAARLAPVPYAMN